MGEWLPLRKGLLACSNVLFLDLGADYASVHFVKIYQVIYLWFVHFSDIFINKFKKFIKIMCIYTHKFLQIHRVAYIHIIDDYRWQSILQNITLPPNTGTRCNFNFLLQVVISTIWKSYKCKEKILYSVVKKH